MARWIYPNLVNDLVLLTFVLEDVILGNVSVKDWRIQMKAKLARLIGLTILLVLCLFNIASGHNHLELKKQQTSIKGNILASESGLSLTNGTIYLDQQQVSFSDGYYEINNLKPGLYLIKIEGPFRRPYENTLLIEPGTNRIDFSLDSRFSTEEIHLLARITRAEAEGESKLGQTAVAATILNRVLSNKYPNSIQEVVYQTINGRYQYSPVYDGRINVKPRFEDYQAAYLALAGHDPTYGATGFFNPAKTRDAWVHSQKVTTQIGGHRFFIY